MAKIRIYLRIAKKRTPGYKISASSKVNHEPLYNVGYGGQKDFLPTVAFAVDFEVPDELFNKAASVIGEINIQMKNAEVAHEVVVPSLKKGEK